MTRKALLIGHGSFVIRDLFCLQIMEGKINPNFKTSCRCPRCQGADRYEPQRYQDVKTQAETGKILQEVEKLNQEVAQLREQWMVQLQSQIDAIQL